MPYETGRVPTIHVGAPGAGAANDWKRCESIDICYHGFENLVISWEGEAVRSPEFTCFGHRWRVDLYPGGVEESTRGMVALTVLHRSHEKIITATCRINIRAKDYSRISDTALVVTSGELDWGDGIDGIRSLLVPDFSRLSTILDNLLDGSLIIEVRMIHANDKVSASSTIPFIAENPLPKAILRKFMDDESSDVLFEVSGGTSTGHKRTKASTAFHAHRLILQGCTSTLGELCKPGADSSPIPITDVEPEIFRHMLYYVYGGRVSEENLKANAKELIDAADKYGVVGLKLEAEAYYVTSEPVTIDNIIDNLLYSDAKNCALLKEAAMDFLVEIGDDAIEKLSFDDVPGHMMKDLLRAVNRGKEKSSAGADANKGFKAMRVSALRKMLHEKGLDIDGSREAMIARLEANCSD